MIPARCAGTYPTSATRIVVSDALNVMQLATEAATVVVAEMAKSGWQAVREAMIQIFRRGGEETARTELQVLDDLRERLMAADDHAGQTLQHVSLQLAMFLRRNPSAVPQLRSMIDQFAGTTQTMERVSLSGVSDSQVVIAGGTASAGDFRYGAPEAKQ